ncbi:MAG TPA: hypothetical protein VNM22_08885 [Candidatus Limnocylindrales bacterium]|nr:hypothetical protein [Candidatus Limnocylindrales bacterium]
MDGLASRNRYIWKLLPIESRILTALDKDSQQQRWIVIYWLIAGVMGAIRTWATRHTMNADGISYLDMGDAYLRGDWSMALNTLWSPFYSWLLGLALLVLKPSPYWEFTVVHLVNFIIYIWALSCFHFFLFEWIHYNGGPSIRFSKDRYRVLPEGLWLSLGYILFIWSSLELITLSAVTPDLCVAAFVYLASGLLLRIRKKSTSWFPFVLLGATLGLSYLTKAFMFPLAFIFLGVSILVDNPRITVLRTLIALMVFLLITSPFIIALSKVKGRLTFGDSGKLNYVWHVNEIPGRHWQGDSLDHKPLVHPTQQIYEVPPVYEFAFPVGGTYPPWYDPSYWYEGVKPHFRIIQQAKALLRNLCVYFRLLLGPVGALMIGLSILFYKSGQGPESLRDIRVYWPLLIPVLTAQGLFLLVHVERRYIAPFIVITLVVLFAGIRLTHTNKRLVPTLTLAVLMAFILSTVPKTVGDVLSIPWGQPHIYWQVAEGLKRIGVQPGDKVASTSYSHSINVKWARLARVQIIAEVYSQEGDGFWTASPVIREQILAAFAKAGAKVVVTDMIPDSVDKAGWQQVGDTGYYAYFLAR